MSKTAAAGSKSGAGASAGSGVPARKDVIRRVRKLDKLAADRRTPLEVARSAATRAATLRSRYALQEHEITGPSFMQRVGEALGASVSVGLGPFRITLFRR